MAPTKNGSMIHGIIARHLHIMTAIEHSALDYDRHEQGHALTGQFWLISIVDHYV